MIKGFKYVFKNKYNIILILTHIGAPFKIAGEQHLLMEHIKRWPVDVSTQVC
jgi:hypothetical protein